MTKTVPTLVALAATVLTQDLWAIEAQITIPVDGVFISADEAPGGDFLMGGASNTGQVAWIRPIVNGTQQGFVSDPDSGTWSHEIRLVPGVNELFIIARCNYAGCSREGEDSPKRFVTLVAPPSGGAISSSHGESADEIPIHWRKFVWTSQRGSSPVITPYYRVWRNSTVDPTGADLEAMTGWLTATEFVDTTAEPGTLYYYFAQVATSSTGANASALAAQGSSGYRQATLVLDSHDVSAAPEGELIPIGIGSNTNWVVQSFPDWVEVSSDANGVDLTVNANDSGAPRSGVVELHAGADRGNTQSISVSQSVGLLEAREAADLLISRTEPGSVSLSWDTLAGFAYELQASIDLGTWTILTTVDGDGSEKSFVDTAGLIRRFYRIVLSRTS